MSAPAARLPPLANAFPCGRCGAPTELRRTRGGQGGKALERSCTDGCKPPPPGPAMLRERTVRAQRKRRDRERAQRMAEEQRALRELAELAGAGAVEGEA